MLNIGVQVIVSDDGRHFEDALDSECMLYI